MALARDFKQTVLARAVNDAAFRRGLLTDQSFCAVVFQPDFQ